MQWIIEKNGYTFAWDIGTDSATLTANQSGKLVWQGTLMPGFDMIHQNERVFQKAHAIAAELSETGGIIQLELDGHWQREHLQSRKLPLAANSAASTCNGRARHLR